MKVSEIENRVKEIRKLANESTGDAHGLEDDLYADVISAIAKGALNAQKLAAAAIRTKEINFARFTE